MASELDQPYAEATNERDDKMFRGTKDFEEILAETVYEELSLISRMVAPALNICIRGATSVEIGRRKARLNMDDCEEFEKGLEKVFGFGAKVIECRILKALNTKIGVSKEIEQNFRFSDEVKTARRFYKPQRYARKLP